MPQPCELFLNDTSEENYNGNWAYIYLAQLQSSEDVCVVNKVILFKVIYYILAKQDSKVEYSNRSGTRLVLLYCRVTDPPLIETPA